MVATVEKMLRDKDPQVVANSIVALEEINAEEGGACCVRTVSIPPFPHHIIIIVPMHHHY